MAYLGNAPAEKYISFERQVFTIVNSQTAYTLSHSVTNENDIRLVVNNIVQEPGSGKAYTASGTTLTLSAALVNGTDEMYCVFLGRAVGTVNAPAGSVGTSQLAADSVTNAKIADDAISDEQLDPTVITGQTAETSIATDDLILLSDTSASGALKKMTRANFVSGIGGTNTPSFLVTGGNSNQTINNNVYTKVEYNQEVFDTASAFSSNRFTVPSGQAGKYFFSAQLFFEDSDYEGKRLILEFKKNNSGIKYNQIRFNSNNASVICFPAIITTLDDASVGDYYEVFIYQETSNNSSVILENASTSYANNFFSGFKIIE